MSAHQTIGRGPVVCVFCGSSPGKSPAHLEAARELAKMFHEKGISLVYGGGTAGIMGEIAKTLVSLSGPDAVHGVIPSALIRFERDESKPAGVIDKSNRPDSQASPTLPTDSEYGRTTVVPDMHTRKQLMAQEVMAGGKGSGFVALSGGYGTMEELMEVTTWNQLGIHSRPIIVYNVNGFYDGLLQWVRTAVEGGFISQSNQKIMVEAKSPAEVWNVMQMYQVSEGRLKLDWGHK